MDFRDTRKDCQTFRLSLRVGCLEMLKRLLWTTTGAVSKVTRRGRQGSGRAWARHMLLPGSFIEGSVVVHLSFE
jgi:hypothetical protein